MSSISAGSLLLQIVVILSVITSVKYENQDDCQDNCNANNHNQQYGVEVLLVIQSLIVVKCTSKVKFQVPQYSF